MAAEELDQFIKRLNLPVSQELQLKELIKKDRQNAELDRIARTDERLMSSRAKRAARRRAPAIPSTRQSRWASTFKVLNYCRAVAAVADQLTDSARQVPGRPAGVIRPRDGLPYVDAECARLFATWCGAEPGPHSVRVDSPLVELMAAGGHEGLSTTFRAWAVLFIGALFECYRWADQPWADGLKDPMLRLVVQPRCMTLRRAEQMFIRKTQRLIEEWPEALRRIRRCDYHRCYQFFLDRSRSYCTNPARACKPSHAVLLHRERGARRPGSEAKKGAPE